MVNLINNAIKFSDTKTRIELIVDIKTHFQKDIILFKIKDEGYGIKDLTQVGDMFQSLNIK